MRGDDRMMMQADERALLAAMARGDQAALRQLYALYRPPLRRYFWQQLDGDEPAVEDALQEVFLAAWRAAGGFRGDARVSTWLYRIAHYHVLHLRRDTARRPEGHLVALARDDEDGPDWPDEPSRGAHDDEVLDRLTLEEALSRLSTRHREALELVFQHGFALDEAAQILDVPLGTVKSRISYARKALQKELGAARAAGIMEEARRDA